MTTLKERTQQVLSFAAPVLEECLPTVLVEIVGEYLYPTPSFNPTSAVNASVSDDRIVARRNKHYYGVVRGNDVMGDGDIIVIRNQLIDNRYRGNLALGVIPRSSQENSPNHMDSTESWHYDMTMNVCIARGSLCRDLPRREICLFFEEKVGEALGMTLYQGSLYFWYKRELVCSKLPIAETYLSDVVPYFSLYGMTSGIEIVIDPEEVSYTVPEDWKHIVSSIISGKEITICASSLSSSSRKIST